MKRTTVILAGAAALALLVGALPACKEQVELTELEKFVQRTVNLEGSALEDTLRDYAAPGSPYAKYASFLLGNHFHTMASDTAAVLGWNAEAVSTLLDSAEANFAAAVARDSSFVEALVNLGSVWDDRSEQRVANAERQQRLNEAERFYRLALRADPADEKARCNLGGLFLRQRRTQEALDEFQTALEHNPESPLAHYNLAIMFAEQKMYREAMREWELAAKYDPEATSATARGRTCAS
jgi:tetratricopeptide (TPR) repeat protein